MPRKPKLKRATTDSRGIPFDMDPLKFYEYKANLIAAESEGVEWLLYKLFGPSNIRSIVFAIDPFARTRLSAVRISPRNRKSSIIRTSVLDDIYLDNNNRTLTTTVDYRNGKITVFTSGNSGRSLQSSLNSSSASYIFDTSASSRGEGSNFGEADFCFFDFYAPSRRLTNTLKTVAKTNIDCVTLESNRLNSWSRFAAVKRTSIPNIRDFCLTNARNELGRNKANLVRQALPFSRSFNLGRSVAELKDLPRSIATLRSSLFSLRSTYNSFSNASLRDRVFSLKNNAKQIPDEYLSFHFGWKQLYSDIVSTLKKPERINKDINRLIERNGQMSSYTSSMKYSLGRAHNFGTSFSFGSSGYDDQIRTGIDLVDKIHLRCVLQAKFDFPPAMELLYREDLFSRKMGVIPSPVDLYNLVPWSWLIDWFSGLGQYLHLIEEMTSDPSLINFGFASCKMESTFNVSRDMRTLTSSSAYSNNGGASTWTYDYNKSTYGCQAIVTSYVREDVSSLASIRSAATGVNLTSFQQSIIGALLAQRSKH